MLVHLALVAARWSDTVNTAQLVNDFFKKIGAFQEAENAPLKRFWILRLSPFQRDKNPLFAVGWIMIGKTLGFCWSR
jgi:hypothetical protein